MLEREGKGRRVASELRRREPLFPWHPFLFILFPAEANGSVNIWKQTELVAISGLQIHFVPKEEYRLARRVCAGWLSLGEVLEMAPVIVCILTHACCFLEVFTVAGHVIIETMLQDADERYHKRRAW